MRAPERPVQRLFASNLLQGENVQPILRNIASGLNQGYPNGWERYAHTPVSGGSSSIQMVTADDLRPAMQNWGLNGGVLDQAYDRVHTAIELAVSEAVYFAQGFSYNWSECQGGGDHPACLSTLMVVVKVPDVTDDGPWRAEVGHIYISTVAETLQQWVPWHRCHRTLFGPRCHDGADPRNLDMQELEVVKTVMSTFQSDWAMNNLPQPPTDLPIISTDVSVSSSFETSIWPSLFDSLLRLFLSNPVENRDVRKIYRGGLLSAIQNATLSHRQGFHNMELSVGGEAVVPLLEDILSACFDKAGIEQSIEEWWRRVYIEGQSDPVSLECEFVSQRKVSSTPPRSECVTSTNVTIDTAYNWALIAPRGNLFDVLFMEGEVGVSFEDCVPFEDDDQEDGGSVHTMSVVFDDEKSSGSMVRWAYVDPTDGSFYSVQYLAEWSEYPSHVTKIVLDFLRRASASSYLKVPVYDRRPTLLLQQYELPNGTTGAMDPSFVALMGSIQLFAETWEKVAKAFGTSSVTSIQRRVCLGFDTLDYKASTGVMQGVANRDMSSLVEEMIDIEELPKRDDLRRLMAGVKYATNITWMAESMTFTNPAGEQSYFFFAKYGNAATGLADVVYSTVKSKFTIAQDMLVVRRQKSVLGGIYTSDETSIQYVPHTLTLNDTLILELFWEMIAFHQLAIALGGVPPQYPDLSGLCDRSIP